jgi:hypothetical protein
MSTRSSALLDAPSAIGSSQSVRNRSTVVTGNTRLLELMKSTYQADQQVKYLHLQAEVESLLQQLQILKQQRLTSVQPDSDN